MAPSVITLDRPTSGAITLDGQRLDGLADDGLTAVRRDTLGFIFQFFNLLPSLSCIENVALPLHLRGWPLPAPADLPLRVRSISCSRTTTSCSRTSFFHRRESALGESR